MYYLSRYACAGREPSKLCSFHRPCQRKPIMKNKKERGIKKDVRAKERQKEREREPLCRYWQPRKKKRLVHTHPWHIRRAEINLGSVALAGAVLVCSQSSHVPVPVPVPVPVLEMRGYPPTSLTPRSKLFSTTCLWPSHLGLTSLPKPTILYLKPRDGVSAFPLPSFPPSAPSPPRRSRPAPRCFTASLAHT